MQGDLIVVQAVADIGGIYIDNRSLARWPELFI